MPVMTRTKRALDVFATVALIMSAAAVSWSLLIRPWRGSAARSQVERLKGVSLAGSLLANATGSGPVAIVEVSDFQCPYCGTYARESWPSVKRDLVDAGRVRYVSMHFPLEQIHPLANGAAEAAECAARAGRFWEMHDRLFHAANALSRADLVQHAQVVGV